MNHFIKWGGITAILLGVVVTVYRVVTGTPPPMWVYVSNQVVIILLFISAIIRADNEIKAKRMR